ncbi:acyl dehydratase [Dactylosporangium sp. CA-092794]|uniref:acyl dehydratase n=1 Tax=Dactylosporangium sp. CA-092794 TaxID=3239929 RepID=UPI003D91E986
MTANGPGRPAYLVGQTRLPSLRIPVTTTFVVTTAIASNDFMAVHHDRDAAQAQGSRDIFTNILTDTGLISRYVTDWAGPAAVIRKIAVKLQAQNPVGELLEISGEVTGESEPGTAEILVRATNGLGTHCTATVTVAWPAGERGEVVS